MSIRSRVLAAGAGWPAPARVAAVLFFAASLADGTLMPFFAPWAVRDAGVPVGAVGLLLGSYAGGELLATPFVGGLSDRRGRRPVLLVSTAGVGVGFLALHLAHGAVAAAAALLVIGGFESVLHPTAAAIAADVAPAAALRRHYGLNRMAASLGAVLGPALGAVLATRSLAAVFLAAGAMMLLASATVAFGLAETHPARTGATGGDEDDDDLASLGAVLRDRRLAAILLPVAVVGLATSWVDAVIPLAATHRGALSPSAVGWMFSYAGALGVVLQLPVGRASRDMGASRLVFVAVVLLAATFATLLFVPAPVGFVLALTTAAASGVVLSPLVQALVMETAPAHARATYTAALSVVADLRDAAGPAIGTALFSLGTRMPWLVGLLLAPGAGLVLMAGLRPGVRGRGPGGARGRAPPGD